MNTGARLIIVAMASRDRGFRRLLVVSARVGFCAARIARVMS